MATQFNIREDISPLNPPLPDGIVENSVENRLREQVESLLESNALYYSKLLALASWIRRTYIDGTCPFDAFYPCPSMKREVVRVMGCTPDCQCDCDGDWRGPHHIHADLCWRKFIIDSDVKAWRKED